MNRKLRLIAALLIVLGLIPAAVIATPADGNPDITFGSGNDVGASTDSVYAVALGDLDNDGDLDIVSGSGPAEDYEIIVWQNDVAPFAATWTANDVGTTGGSYGIDSIAVGDVDNDGDLDIIAGSSFGDVTVWQNDGTPFTDTWTSNAVGTLLWGAELAVGDLDNDGWLDIACGAAGTDDYEVAVFENDGSPFTGSWGQNDVGTTGSDSVYWVAIGDLDNDGWPDIVSGSADTDDDYQIIAWENDGSPFGGLWSGNNVGAAGDRVNSVALGDLDSDGYLDIASGSSWDATYHISVWQNDGTPFSSTWTENGASPGADTVLAVAVGDLDNDGDLDIAAGLESPAGTEVAALQNDGTPFSGYWTLSEAGHSDSDGNWVAIGDLDNDGDLDLVTGSDDGEDYEIIACPNTLAQDSLPLGLPGNDVAATLGHIYDVATGDLDNDGDLDILSASTFAADYEIVAWQNDRTPFEGTWTSNDAGSATASIYGVALGDLDNDGDLDAVSVGNLDAESEIVVWENDGTPFSDTWPTNDAATSYTSVWEVALGDLDNDGDLDMAVVRDDGGSDEVLVLQNNGSPFAGSWTANDVGDSTADVNTVALGDLDNDGDLDIVTGSESGEDYEIIAWLNDTSPFTGTWSSNDVGASLASMASLALGDLDNDGDLDIVSGGNVQEDYEVIAWQNDGAPFTGTWALNDVGTTDYGVGSVVLGDMDNNGDLDIVSVDKGSANSEIIVWESDGTPFSGLWTENAMGTHDAHLYCLTLGDFDLDGDLDVVSGSASGATFEVIAWQNRDNLRVYLPLVLRSY
ncbi:MAG: VCBS repeat-containing protein [Anaerolineales bacterium]|nr:MAG: VCBS repeat-containing protein [Anaerolineales bacterium]